VGGGPRFALRLGGPGGGIGTGISGMVPTDDTVEGLDDCVIGDVIMGDASSSSSNLIPRP
jgi:hypothetical protein